MIDTTNYVEGAIAVIEMGSMRFTTTNKLAEDLSAHISKGKISFALPIQRGYVWDLAKKSAFILNMIEGGPTFPIYVNRKKGVDQDIDYVIDGQQRGRTSNTFIENRFSLSKLPPIKLPDGRVFDVTGKKFKQLEPEFKKAILDYNFEYNYADNLSDEQVKTVFIRLNSGKPLSATEMTKAQIQPIFEVKKLAQHNIFKAIVNAKGFESSKHEDIIMQLYVVFFEDNIDLLATHIRKALAEKSITDDEKNTILQCLDGIEKVYSKLNSDNGFEAKRAAIFLKKKVHFVSFAYVVRQCLENDAYDLELLFAWAKYFFNGEIDQTSVSEEYNALLLHGTNKRESVKGRLESMHQSFLSFRDKMNCGGADI